METQQNTPTTKKAAKPTASYAAENDFSKETDILVPTKTVILHEAIRMEGFTEAHVSKQKIPVLTEFGWNYKGQIVLKSKKNTYIIPSAQVVYSVL